jgi:ubiquinol-cytochrome c reductase cytochrome b subunit
VRRRSRQFVDWLDDRTGFRTIRHHLLEEQLVPGTGWWFTLGSVLLLGLTVQFITGIALALYYAPTPDHAWDSVRYITTVVHMGGFLRGLHHWGASAVVVAAILHLIRVVAFGSYHRPREVNWLVGILLLLVILGSGLTGYLLPWDQRAFWATVVSINISKLTPVFGDQVAALLRGGESVGALTLTRWYALHVLVLPITLITLTIVHLYLMRRQGISGPIRPKTTAPQAFFPYQAARDLVVAIFAGTILAVLAYHGAPALEAPADPTSSDYIPRPEWYFLGLFQLLKFFPGKWEVVGALVIPGLALIFLASLPWIDRGGLREWKHRRAILGTFAAGLASAITLTALGARDHPSSGAVPWNVREVAGMGLVDSSQRCTKCHSATGVAAPIEAARISHAQDWVEAHVADPEMITPGLREAPATNDRDTAAILAALRRLRVGAPSVVDAATLQTMIAINRSCLGCHRIDGVGGDEGPDLSHVGKKFTADDMAKRITNPVDVKPDAEMPAFGGKLSPETIRAIAQWLATRQ